MDIDKDGYLSEQDIQTCINNLNSHSFFDYGRQSLSQSQFNSQIKFHQLSSDLFISNSKAFEVCKQITDKLASRKISIVSFFNMCDIK